MAKRIKLGDMLQVLTSEGVAYAQVTHKHPEFGFLIRIFQGFYSQQPKNFSAVVVGEVQFSAFFVAQAAVNQGLVSVVANVEVPEALKSFPIFRARSGGAGGSIWLWDGTKHFRLERKLTADELKYPTDGIISAPLLVERIENGYRAELDENWT